MPITRWVHEYARVVVDDEWSNMARGKASRRASDALHQLWEIFHEFEPRTARDNAFYAESLRRLNLLGDYRRLRLLSSQSEMPRVFWVLLVLGGVVTVGYTYCFGVEKLSAHAVMTATLAGMLAFILALILLLEHPFSGDLSVSPQAFKQVLERFEQVHPLATSPHTHTQTR